MSKNSLHIIFTPLEQFAGLNTIENLGQTIFGIFFCFDVVVYQIILLLIICFLLIFYNSTVNVLHSIVPTKLQAFLFALNKIFLETFKFTFLKTYKQTFYSTILVLFFWLIFLNAIGLIPLQYSLLTCPTEIFGLGLNFFLLTVCYSISRGGLKIFSLLYPGGTDFTLLFLILPIEMLSVFIRPISLSIRLFANIVAGQILIKIVLAIFWTAYNFMNFVILEPIYIIILCFLLLLEFVVVILQAFVFSILVTLYISEMIFFE